MTGFLERIAKKIYAENGNDLRNHCLVFPNRRAGLYFLKYLSAEIKQPVWTPAIVTINELFRSFSKLKNAENEILLTELYKVYRRIKKSPENFDDFFFWGDMMLNDFDDIDKYLVNAGSLFTNVRDIKKIDELFGGLTDSQIEIIKRFWVNFEAEKPTKEKAGFIATWEVLDQLYIEFRNFLQQKNLGYEGMIFRDVIESFDNGSEAAVKWKKIHFIGFNALNECEKAIMTRLKKLDKACFYWDYDNSYIIPGKLNSAGYFMKDNLKKFGNDMPTDWSFDTLLSADSSVVSRRVIDASSDVAQVKLIPALLKGITELTSENAHHTAVVLADENLLMPVLTSIPEDIGNVNITMGYPLKQTDVYSLVRDLLDLQRNSSERDGVLYFGYRSVNLLLRNGLMANFINRADEQLVNGILKSGTLWIPSDRFSDSPQLSRIFKKQSTPSILSDYIKDILSSSALDSQEDPDQKEASTAKRNLRNEFIYRVVLTLNRLETISKSQDIIISTETWMRIFEKLLRAQSVPFSGEPLSGVQIMGILETRVLDFENLIILSVNEGILPSVSAGSSFIPFSLREAFGLPSINHQESIYAYHFYRLLQRAKNVTFVYNSNPDGLRSGEMSRFLLQMKYEPVLKPDFIDLNYEIKTHTSLNEIVTRTADHSLQLKKRFLNGAGSKVLSPSAINTWIGCRMKFYYRYVNNLTEPEKYPADIDPAMLGNLLHEIMTDFYLPLKGKLITAEFLKTILSDKGIISGIIDKVFCEKFNSSIDVFINGNELIVRDVLLKYFIRILNADKNYAPFTILNIEENFSFTVNSGNIAGLKIGGKVDRIDVKDDVVRVIDYKTGIVADSIKSLQSLFSEERKKDADGWLQTLLYCEAYIAENKGVRVCPTIYNVKKNHGDKLIGSLVIKDDSRNEFIVRSYDQIRQEFLPGLISLADNIFSTEQPFSMAGDIWNKCGNCTYNVLCLR